MKMTAFWDVAPCSLVEVDRRFRGAFCHLHQQGRTHLGLTHSYIPSRPLDRGTYYLNDQAVESLIALIMETVSIIFSSVNFYEITQHNIKQDCHICTRCRENLKSLIVRNPVLKPRFKFRNSKIESKNVGPNRSDAIFARVSTLQEIFTPKGTIIFEGSLSSRHDCPQSLGNKQAVNPELTTVGQTDREVRSYCRLAVLWRR
jgi:hypothetical protein